MGTHTVAKTVTFLINQEVRNHERHQVKLDANRGLKEGNQSLNEGCHGVFKEIQDHLGQDCGNTF